MKQYRELKCSKKDIDEDDIKNTIKDDNYVVLTEQYTSESKVMMLINTVGIKCQIIISENNIKN